MAKERSLARARLRTNLIRCVKLSWQASPAYLSVVVVGMALAGALPALVLVFTRQLVDLVAQGTTKPAVGTTVLVAAFALAGTAALSKLVSESLSYFRMISSEHAIAAASRQLAAATARADIASVEQPSWQDDVQRARGALQWRLQETIQSLLYTATNLINVGSLAGVLLWINPFLILFAIAASAVPLWVERPVRRQLYEQWFHWTPRERERDYLLELLSERASAKEIRAGNLSGTFLDRFGKLVDENRDQKVSLYKRINLRFSITAVSTAALLTAAYWMVASAGAHVSPGSLTAVFGALAGMTNALSVMTDQIIQMEQHAQGLDTLFGLMDKEPAIPVAAKPVVLPSISKSGIDFVDVTFRYPGSTHPALTNVSLQIKPGEMLALVGENGAGKSTLVNLLLRFYDVDSGAVRVANVDVRDAHPDQLRARFGVLFQDFTKYSFTAKENVTLGRAGEPVEGEALLEALTAAQATELVDSLPMGLDSTLGNVFEGGHNISGGQWQRLALARLFYRSAEVWILDEPTSTLDAAAEVAIFSQLRARLGGRIGIVISHRFSTVRIADRIAVMDRGEIIELGTHEELRARDGKYSHLFELQAAGYR